MWPESVFTPTDATESAAGPTALALMACASVSGALLGLAVMCKTPAPVNRAGTEALAIIASTCAMEVALQTPSCRRRGQRRAGTTARAPRAGAGQSANAKTAELTAHAKLMAAAYAIKALPEPVAISTKMIALVPLA